jgi:hypothetical protein
MVTPEASYRVMSALIKATFVCCALNAVTLYFYAATPLLWITFCVAAAAIVSTLVFCVVASRRTREHRSQDDSSRSEDAV